MTMEPVVKITVQSISLDTANGKDHSFKISYKSHLQQYKKIENGDITRKWSDFEWLHKEFYENHAEAIIPALPILRPIHMYPTGEADAKIQNDLQKFLNKVTVHPNLAKDISLQNFLETESDFTPYHSTKDKSKMTKLFSKMTKSVKPSAKEIDSYYDHQKMELDGLELIMEKNVKLAEKMVKNRRALAQALDDIGTKTLAIAGSENNQHLNRGMRSFGQAFEICGELYGKQADVETCYLMDFFENVDQDIKSGQTTLLNRMRALENYENTCKTTYKKRSIVDKLKASTKVHHDKLETAVAEFNDAKQGEADSKQLLSKISETIRDVELPLFEEQQSRQISDFLSHISLKLGQAESEHVSKWEEVVPIVQDSKQLFQTSMEQLNASQSQSNWKDGLRSDIQDPSNDHGEDMVDADGNIIKGLLAGDKMDQFIRELGVGAYGVVCAAKDSETGTSVAIKKIGKIFEKKILAKRTLRELKLLKHFADHENIIGVIDVLKPNSEDFTEIYVVQELMEADMHQIIRSQQPLTDAHFQYFLYQILRGLKYIHSANVLHRDLKPGNLLVNADCELKVCDFGLARGFTNQPDANEGFMTEYVATRWYRAPEIMLSFLQYTKAIDIWSVGCIFAEMLGGKVLFAGKDYIHQLNLILQILGTVPDETLQRIGSKRAQAYVRHLPYMAKVPFAKLFPKATPLALDLLEKLLDFDPARRITVEGALKHPYLETYHDPQDEPTCIAFNFEFESKNKMSELKQLISEEILSYHNNKRPHLRRQSSKQVLTDPNTLEKAGGDGMEGINYVQNTNAAQDTADAELERELEQGVQKLADTSVHNN